MRSRVEHQLISLRFPCDWLLRSLHSNARNGMTHEPPAYRSYLLRLWRAEREGRSTWRASLESAQTGERRTFASLATLCAFLADQAENSDTSGQDSPVDAPT